MVGSFVRFFFTRCKESLNSLVRCAHSFVRASRNSWRKIVRTHQPWSKLYIINCKIFYWCNSKFSQPKLKEILLISLVTESDLSPVHVTLRRKNWKTQLISKVRPTVRTNPSRKLSFSPRSPIWRNLKELAFRFLVDRKRSVFKTMAWR